MAPTQVHDASSLGIIAEFNIASLVPIDGSATFAELSGKTGIDEDRLSAPTSSPPPPKKNPPRRKFLALPN